jgi:hypothetical protein
MVLGQNGEEESIGRTYESRPMGRSGPREEAFSEVNEPEGFDATNVHREWLKDSGYPFRYGAEQEYVAPAATGAIRPQARTKPELETSRKTCSLNRSKQSQRRGRAEGVELSCFHFFVSGNSQRTPTGGR